MLKKVLIANRGEIALRIIRACRDLKISTVAIHSTADTNSMHVRMADESVCIGPPKAGDSYLSIPNIIAGMKISAGLSVIGAIVGEFIIGSGSEQGGLGVQIIYAQANLETSLVMALILTATGLGFAFFMTIQTIGWYLMRKWHESEMKAS